ncbi:MAG: DUF4340 domain-containing protein [Verrucomicrobia bacterium]|nr:DUF4340 domain-containing protein [Verrucomicrobiota bacterium]
MRSRPLIILLVLALAMVGIAVKTRDRATTTAAHARPGGLLLPDLPVNEIARMTIMSDGVTSTVTRTSGVWTLAEKHHYPANFSRVRDALRKFAELKTGDQRRVTPDTRKDFGIVTPAAGQPDATRIELADAGGKIVAALLLGKHHLRKAATDSPYGGEFPDGRYVSADGGDTIYMIKDTLSEINAQGTSWIESEILNIEASQLVRVSLADDAGATLAFTTTESGDALTLEGLADNEELDPSQLASLRNALAYVNLHDVADPALDDAAMGFDSPARFTAETRDGRQIKALIGNNVAGGGRYIRYHVERLGTPTQDTNATAEVASMIASAEDVAALNEKLTPWTFVVPGYKAESLVLTRATLVKPKATPPAELAAEINNNDSDSTPTINAADAAADTESVEEKATVPAADEENHDEHEH